MQFRSASLGLEEKKERRRVEPEGKGGKEEKGKGKFVTALKSSVYPVPQPLTLSDGARGKGEKITARKAHAVKQQEGGGK